MIKTILTNIKFIIAFAVFIILLIPMVIFVIALKTIDNDECWIGHKIEKLLKWLTIL